MKIRFVGDAHGKIKQYAEKIRDAEQSIQVGDMGLGFNNVWLPDAVADHSFIRGNHDSPDACYDHPGYLGDYGYLPNLNLFFLSGAYSIDHMYRVPGKSWWEKEQLSEGELAAAELAYSALKPRYVVTHDCPDSIRQYLLNQIMLGGFRPEKDLPSRTSDALERMFQAHQPKIWVFGHYHIDRDFEYKGTRFICLNELSTVDLELE